MAYGTRAESRERRGFFASLGLAWRIITGTLHLLKRHPKLLLPLMPVFVMAFLISYGIYNTVFFSGAVFMLLLGAVFATAYALMFSFAISSRMLKQIHTGQAVSLTDAVSAPETVRMIPRVLALSIVWYGLVLVLVIIEMIISAVLDRISRGLGQRVVRTIFGVVADALRMAAFMMVVIMVFEDVGLRVSFGRLREIVRDNAIAALGGLALTSMATALIGLILYGISQFLGETAMAGTATLVMLPAMAIGWLLAIYLEQMFVAGLYLYSTSPESPLVDILLGDFVGRELPQPELAELPVVETNPII
jgi:hypothetical protein